MKLNITNKEYLVLLDCIYALDWMIETCEEGDNPRYLPFKAFKKRFLSYAKDFGCKHLIDHDSEDDSYEVCADFDDIENKDSIASLIEDFNNINFWDTLAYRLGQRDVIEDYKDVKELDDETRDEIFIKSNMVAENYTEEFEENGIQNLVIVKK